jgi:hypothetical protein
MRPSNTLSGVHFCLQGVEAWQNQHTSVHIAMMQIAMQTAMQITMQIAAVQTSSNFNAAKI